MLNIYKLNGIYDLICGFNLIFNYSPLLSKLHTNLFKKIDNISKRLLGFILIFLGLMRLSSNDQFIFLSYIFEILIFELELMKNNKNMNIINVKFVSITSLFLAISIIK